MSRYRVELTIVADMDIDDEVIAVALTPEWQAQLYAMQGPDDVLEMLAHNLVLENRRLSQLDGWADRDDHDAVVIHSDLVDFQVLEGEYAPRQPGPAEVE